MNKIKWIGSTSVMQLSSWRIFVATVMAMLLLPVVALAADKGKAEHVVVVVWDGMRPDFISREHTPTLYQLAQDGAQHGRASRTFGHHGQQGIPAAD
jgi:membrane-anchored protein YejM (alkaline phosphatase superfamily)